jgi:hypothetical protein
MSLVLAMGLVGDLTEIWGFTFMIWVDLALK